MHEEIHKGRQDVIFHIFLRESHFHGLLSMVSFLGQEGTNCVDIVYRNAYSDASCGMASFGLILRGLLTSIERHKGRHTGVRPPPFWETIFHFRWRSLGTGLLQNIRKSSASHTHANGEGTGGTPFIANNRVHITEVKHDISTRQRGSVGVGPHYAILTPTY